MELDQDRLGGHLGVEQKRLCFECPLARLGQRCPAGVTNVGIQRDLIGRFREQPPPRDENQGILLPRHLPVQRGRELEASLHRSLVHRPRKGHPDLAVQRHILRSGDGHERADHRRCSIRALHRLCQLKAELILDTISEHEPVLRGRLERFFRLKVHRESARFPGQLARHRHAICTCQLKARGNRIGDGGPIEGDAEYAPEIAQRLICVWLYLCDGERWGGAELPVYARPGPGIAFKNHVFQAGPVSRVSQQGLGWNKGQGLVLAIQHSVRGGGDGKGLGRGSTIQRIVRHRPEHGVCAKIHRARERLQRFKQRRQRKAPFDRTFRRPRQGPGPGAGRQPHPVGCSRLIARALGHKGHLGRRLVPEKGTWHHRLQNKRGLDRSRVHGLVKSERDWRCWSESIVWMRFKTCKPRCVEWYFTGEDKPSGQPHKDQAANHDKQCDQDDGTTSSPCSHRTPPGTSP